MRVFISNNVNGEKIISIWEKDQCRLCVCCGQGGCNQCNQGYLPPKNGRPFQQKNFRFDLSDKKFGAYAGIYEYFSHGSYNLVYRSLNQQWVLKMPINSSDATDLPERAVRVWNVINPDCPAIVLRNSKCDAAAWISPFIHGVLPTQSEVVQKLMEIYERTGRIVADAFVGGNFIKTTENGRVVCIDVGAAFFLESRSSLGRIHSRASLDTWNGEMPMSHIYRDALNKRQKELGEVVSAIKALLYLQMYYPDFRSVTQMTKDEQLIHSLVQGYDARKPMVIRGLEKYIPLSVQSQFVSKDGDSDDELFVEVTSEQDESEQDEDDGCVAAGAISTQSEPSQSESSETSNSVPVVFPLPIALLGGSTSGPSFFGCEQNRSSQYVGNVEEKKDLSLM